MRQATCFIIRAWILALILVLLQLTTTAFVEADLIWIKGASEPVSGRVIEQTSEEIKFQRFDSGSFETKLSLKREDIELLVTNLDPARLESLQPDNPSAYRDYAEELSSQRKDAAAIALARRLYLISAFHSQDAGRLSAISGLIELADSEFERNQFRMLKFLYAPAESTKSNTQSRQGSKAISQASREQMLKIVRSLRQDRSEIAAQILNTKEGKSLVANWSEHFSYDELVRMTQGNRISKVELSKLIAAEVEIVYSNSIQDSVATRPKKWSDFAIQNSSRSAMIPSLENVTELDPKKSIYRNGTWVQP